jgi:hypothetical protein
MLKENQELKDFLNNFDIKMPLNVRDSFFGGRTEPIKLHHKCEGDEKINYYDITSLYPYVQSYRRYPIGHPIIILTDFKDINKLSTETTILMSCIKFSSENTLNTIQTWHLELIKDLVSSA